MGGRLKVLFVSAEVSPLAGVGGLADYAGNLPGALRSSGIDVRIIMPGYGMVLEDDKSNALGLRKRLEVSCEGGESHPVQVWQTTLEDVPVWLVASEKYFRRVMEPRNVYQNGADAYLLFCRAVLEWLQCKTNRWIPDVIHVNDWHTALIPVYLRVYPARYARLSQTSTVCTIHNLANQGEFDPEILANADLPWDLYTFEQLECYGRVNFLKGGIVFSDLVNTVSKTYSQEIQSPEYGCRLDGLLRYTDANHRLWGIVNGIDTEEYSPVTGKRIWVKYSADNPAGKLRNRSRLQRASGLKVTGKLPVVGIVGHLVERKGIDLVRKAMPRLLQKDFQFIFLGTGDPSFERYLSRIALENPGKVSVQFDYNPDSIRRTYAGCDMLLMPSRFEPCGKGQMIALRYGTIPIMRATGGLADTVREFDSEKKSGNGFVFEDYTARALIDAVKRARGVWQQKDVWGELVVSAMRQDWSWNRSARHYISFYEEAIRVHSGQPANAPI